MAVVDKDVYLLCECHCLIEVNYFCQNSRGRRHNDFAGWRAASIARTRLPCLCHGL